MNTRKHRNTDADNIYRRIQFSPSANKFSISDSQPSGQFDGLPRIFDSLADAIAGRDAIEREEQLKRRRRRRKTAHQQFEKIEEIHV